jgi:hypothetical protein
MSPPANCSMTDVSLMGPVVHTHSAQPDSHSMPTNFLAPGGEVAKPTGGMEGGGGSADSLQDDAYRGQHALRECMKTARKVCVAPMMDWTDRVEGPRILGSFFVAPPFGPGLPTEPGVR